MSIYKVDHEMNGEVTQGYITCPSSAFNLCNIFCQYVAALRKAWRRIVP